MNEEDALLVIGRAAADELLQGALIAGGGRLWSPDASLYVITTLMEQGRTYQEAKDMWEALWAEWTGAK